MLIVVVLITAHTRTFCVLFDLCEMLELKLDYGETFVIWLGLLVFLRAINERSVV